MNTTAKPSAYTTSAYTHGNTYSLPKLSGPLTKKIGRTRELHGTTPFNGDRRLKLTYLPSVWSDVAYLVYKNDAGNALYAKYLKYVIRLGISAPDTLEVINHFSLAEPLAGITPSDSTTFAGMSLLGTSDGCSLAWMILSHNIYQLMTITTTSIWRDSNGMINMLQELGPTPDPNVPTYGANPQGPDDPGPGGAGRRLMKRQKN